MQTGDKNKYNYEVIKVQRSYPNKMRSTATFVVEDTRIFHEEDVLLLKKMNQNQDHSIAEDKDFEVTCQSRTKSRFSSICTFPTICNGLFHKQSNCNDSTSSV